jgi:acyl-CoA synthetase (AMP-forming)/AMP-acid ligase II
VHLHLPRTLVHDLLLHGAERDSSAPALRGPQGWMDRGTLADGVLSVTGGLQALGVERGDRVGVWLEKRPETVLACFGTAAACGLFVPINPLLKGEQVAHIASDCGISVLVTSAQRWRQLQHVGAELPELRHVLLVDELPGEWMSALPSGLNLHPWRACAQIPARSLDRMAEGDPAAIFYTSGSTGRPKGVVLSHRNLVAGAESVASYLGNGPHDTLLAALPLSFDAGFSQLTTAFASGARVVLHNYLLPGDLLRALDEHQVTGLTAVPPLFMQLLQARPAAAGRSLRYFATTGGRMPRATLQALRERWPQAQPFLMYGLTEAFRSTYLPPEEVDRRPDSIGRAIPNAEILVLREDGSECGAEEPGELVHLHWDDGAVHALDAGPRA